MSDHRRTADDVKTFIQSGKGFDSQQTMKFYNSCAETYDQDLAMIGYNAPKLVVDFLNANFSGSREEAQVLDVACGSGLVAKLMAEVGFRHFVGVDCSKGMLEQAAKTGLYQDLRLALLGTEPLPAQTGVFDLVIIVGALGVGFAPFSVVRELCHAVKPGGLVCMAKGDHTGAPENKYKEDLERELQLMEEEGLWSLAGLKQTDRYMQNPHLSPERDGKDLQQELFISGKIYLYKKSINTNH